MICVKVAGLFGALKPLRRDFVLDSESYRFGLELPYRPPLDWQSLLGYFRTHHVPGLEAVTGGAYERVLRWGVDPGFVRITHDESKQRLTAQVLGSDPDRL